MGTLIHTKDQALFNCIAGEVNRLAGMYCYYYVLNTVQTTRDALWDEADETVYDYEPNGVKLACFGTNPEHALTTGEEGRRKQWDAEIWIARIHWDPVIGDGAKPKAGDVVNCWGKYYDVVDASRDGVMDDDRNIYVGWKIAIRRMTKFEPKRRPDLETTG